MQKLMIIIRSDEKALDPKAVRVIQEHLSQRTRGECSLLFSSAEGNLMALMVVSDAAPRMLLTEIEPMLRPKDRGFMWIVEIGDSFSAVGNSAGWRHLQRAHDRSSS